MLQCASVIGLHFPLTVLEAVAETSDEVLRAALESLKEAEFIYEAQLFPDLEYTFKHALMKEVTYASMLKDRRSDLHRRIGETIESQFAHRPELYASLHYHFTCAEAWDKLARLHLSIAQ